MNDSALAGYNHRLRNVALEEVEQSIRLVLKKYARNGGIKRNITPHMFRHLFATYLIEEGVDISWEW